MELRCVGRIRIDAVGAAGADHADRRLLIEHGAHLHRRGVRPQQQPRVIFLRIEEEGVVHLARRMPFGEIQPGEIVVVGLDVGALGHRESHVGEDGGEFVPHLAERMDAAGLRRRIAQRQRDVEGLGGEPGVEGRGLQNLAAGRERLVHRVLGAVDRRALGLALVRRHLAEGGQQCRDRALLAKRRHPHGFQRGFVGGGRDVGKDLGLERVEIGHGHHLHSVMPGLDPGIHPVTSDGSPGQARR